MTKEEAKRRAEIMMAFANGSDVQFYNGVTKQWEDIRPECVLFESTTEYRVKPEQKYRPFKNQEECWNEMLKHQPFGWFRSAYNENLFNIVGINNDGIKITNTLTKSMETYSQAFKSLKFTDGTPVGIKEDIKS